MKRFLFDDRDEAATAARIGYHFVRVIVEPALDATTRASFIVTGPDNLRAKVRGHCMPPMFVRHAVDRSIMRRVAMN